MRQSKVLGLFIITALVAVLVVSLSNEVGLQAFLLGLKVVGIAVLIVAFLFLGLWLIFKD